MEFLLIYICVISLLVLAIFKAARPKSNPLKKMSFWVTMLVANLLIIGGTFALFLYGMGGGHRTKYKEGWNYRYWANGQKQEGIPVKNGKWNGYKLSWDSTGRLTGKQMYVDNQQQDSSIQYWPNGKISAIEIFDSGTLRQSYYYYTNGQAADVFRYNEMSYHYFSDGKLIMEQQVVKGMYEGKTTWYYKNGKPKLTGMYKRNNKDGIWVKLDSLTGAVADKDSFDFQHYNDFKPGWK
jgi:hypothetical protein